jgi:PPP family 3-phenylpropionic acid transporter
MPQEIDRDSPTADVGPSATRARDPRVALSFSYAAMFGHLGIVLPFLAPWIRSRGYGPAVIGLLMALPALAKVVAPWGWGRWADRSGRRRELLIVAGLVASAALAAMVFAESLYVLALLMAAYGFMRSPILPYLEATALEQAELRRFGYGPVRLWGSLAFVVSASGFGALQRQVPLDSGLLIGAGFLLVGALLALALPRPSRRDPAGAGRGTGGATETSAVDVGRLRLLAACALMQVSHGAYYIFYSIRLLDLGYGSVTVGWLWALAVICEILLLARLDRIVDRFGPTSVLHTCLLIAAARWLLIGWATELGWLVLGQTLHAATYAAFHVAAIRLVYRSFGSAQRARGQAMYSGMTFGLGMLIGSLLAGSLAELVGLSGLFYASSAVALAAVLVLGRPGAARGTDGEDAIDETRGRG